MALSDFLNSDTVGTSPTSKSNNTRRGLSSFLLSNNSENQNNLNTVEGLASQAESSGLGNEVTQIIDENPKLSFLQRLGKGLGAFNPAEAILTGQEKGVGTGVLEYGKDILRGFGSAITGNDYEGGRRTFSDVAEKMGINNGIAKFGIGFLGDVLLDPSTYFGGAIARGILKSAAKTGELAITGVGKVSPEIETGIKMTGKGVKDALGRAFVHGYGTSGGLAEKSLEIQSKLAKTKEGIVASNLARLGTDTLSSSQQNELMQKLLAGKIAEFEIGKGTQGGIAAAQEAAQSANPLIQKTIKEQTIRSQKFAKQAGIQDPYEIYFPGLKADKIKKFVKSSKTLRVGSEGYRKEFKNLLTDEQLIKNPAEAFANREWQIAKDNIVKDELRGIVREYGESLNAFKTEDEALKSGYKLVKERGLFGKEIGYLKEADKKFLDNLISPEFTTIDMIAKHTGYDAVTSLFKRAVTGLFAPFHVRNYVSGIIQNFEVLGVDALNPRAISAGQKMAWKLARGEKFADKIINIGDKEINFKDVAKPFEERFGGSSSYISDIGEAIRDAGKFSGKILGKESIKNTVKTAGLGQQAIPFRVARSIGNFIETQQKASAYLVALGQGKTIKEALDQATRAGFDYRALTGFESKIMRRIIPFYSFTRKNIELQLKTFGENPQRINQVMKFFENMGDKPTEEEKKNLPDFIRESLGVKLQDTPEGLKQYISSFGTPIEAFTQLFGSNPILRTISTFNPILKTPIEIGIGKDSFRQRDLKDVYDAREYKLAPQIIKDMLDIKEIKKPVYKKGIDRKLIKVGERIQYVANPEKLLIARSLFTSRGVSYLDQVFGNDLQGFVKLIKTTTGIKPQQVDIEMQKSIKERDKKRELEDLLTRTGKIKQFQINYIPKK